MPRPLDLQDNPPTSQAKTVVDWNHRVLGTLAEGPSRRAKDGLGLLSVHLGPDAKDALGSEEEDIDLPSNLVSAIRRDQIVLDRKLEDLATELLDDGG